MKKSPLRVIAGAVLFAAAPCASASPPGKTTDVVVSLGDGASGSQPRPTINIGTERSSDRADVHRQLEAARARLARVESRMRREEMQRFDDDAMRTAIEAKTRSALDALQVAGGVEVRDQIGGVTISISSRLLFVSGAVELRPEAAGLLRSVAEALAQEAESRILIVDKGDRVSSDENVSSDLSPKRSIAVRDFLVSHGVRSGLVRAKADDAKAVFDDSASPAEHEHGIQIIVESMAAR